MKSKLLCIAFSTLLFTALGGFFLLMVGAARAEGVDEKIKVLEQELARLKAEQVDLKKEAVAAAAALPTFSYRPGGGVTVMAADKSWALNFRYVMHIYMYNYTDGNDARGASAGDVVWRRNWFWTNYCWADCFYDVQFALDMDTADQVQIQYTGLYFHFEQMNPYFPTFYIVDKGGRTAAYVDRSSSTSAQVESSRDLVADSDQSTLSHRAIGVSWPNVPLGQGDVELSLEYKPGAGIEKNVTDDSDHQQFFVRLGARPFLRSKNPWTQKLKFGGTLQVDSIDSRQASADNNRLRLRTDDRIGSGVNPPTLSGITVFDTGASAPPARGIGDGVHQFWVYGVEWGYGPYLIRADGASSLWDGRRDAFRGVHGNTWSIGNDLFLWSPRGFLTGSATTPGSVQVGFRFARANMDCGTGTDCMPGLGRASRNHLLHREWDLWYYVRPAFRVGLWTNWWDAANTPRAEQVKVGCSKNTTTDSGKSCDWVTVNLGLSLDF